MPYTTQGPRSNESPAPSREFSTSSSDRFRPPPLLTSPSSGRVSGDTPTYPNFFQMPTSSFSGALPAAAQQFQPGYQQVQRQQLGFTTYNSDMMYSPPSQAAQSVSYDSGQQFQARQPTGIQMLSEVPGPFFQNEPTSTSSASGLQHHGPSGSSMYPPQQSPASRSLQQAYSGSTSTGGASQSGSEAIAQEDLPPPTAEVIAEYALYNTTLREVFQNIINGRLSEASQSLLGASEWLLGHVEALGKCSIFLLDLAR